MQWYVTKGGLLDGQKLIVQRYFTKNGLLDSQEPIR